MSDSRIGRLRFIAYSIVVFLLSMPVLVGVFWLVSHGHPFLGGLLSICMVLVNNVFNVAFSIRRLHDMNASGWWALVNIPIFVISVARNVGWRPDGLMFWIMVIFYLAIFVYIVVLIFVPGSREENRFGLPSPPNTGWVIAGSIVGISLPFVACSAAIAIPAYQVSVIRSQVEQGVRVATAARKAILDYVAIHKTWPTDLKSAFPASAKSPVSRYVDAVAMTSCAGDVCQLTVTFDDNNSNRLIQERTLEMWTDDGGNVWHCGPGTENPVRILYLPESCRENGAP